MRIKHFIPVTMNVGDSMISLMSRYLIQEIWPGSEIITFEAPLTEEKINKIWKPDIIVIGGGPLWGSIHLRSWPEEVKYPVYGLGLGTMVYHGSKDYTGLALNPLKNLRAISTREEKTKSRILGHFKGLEEKSFTTGCPVMHLARPQYRHLWGGSKKQERGKAYGLVYLIPRCSKSLRLNKNKLKKISQGLGVGTKDIILLTHTYKTGNFLGKYWYAWRAYDRVCRKFKIPLLQKEGFSREDFVEYYDPLAYLSLYSQLDFLISYQLHASIMAAAVGTPFLHIWRKESDRTRDMIDTYDPEQILHLENRESHTIEDVIKKTKQILENPSYSMEPYLSRVSKAFKEWEQFKKFCQEDSKTL